MTLKTTLAAVVCGLAIASCGGDDEPRELPIAGGGPPAATASAQAETTPAGEKTAEATASPEDNGPDDSTPTPAKTKREREIERNTPHTTPIPGPPLEFTATFKGDEIETTTDSVPGAKPLKVTLVNETDETLEVFLLSNGGRVGLARIEKGMEIFVLVRNLDPGKLVIKDKSGRKTTLEVEPLE